MHAHLHFGWLSLSLLACLLVLVTIRRMPRWLPLRDWRTWAKIRRPAAVITGMGVVWVVSASPWSGFDHCLLTFHMVRHLLLMMVAAPMILSGSSFSLTASDHRSALVRLLFHPVFCWLAAAAAVIGWHLPPFFELALHSQPWHSIEDGSFLAAGLLFWLPVMHVGRRVNGEGWFVQLYLFLATLPCDILSAFLVFCGRIVYPSYRLVTRSFGFTPLADQEFAGALMWVTVTFAYLIPAALVTIQKLSPSPASAQWKGREHGERTVIPRRHPLTGRIASRVEGL